jgi:hypothetical protein
MDSHGSTWHTVATVARILGRSERQARRIVAQWEREGSKRVRRVPGVRGDSRGAMEVLADDIEAMLVGERPEREAA